MFKFFMEDMRSWFRIKRLNKKFNCHISHKALIRFTSPELFELADNVTISAGTFIAVSRHAPDEKPFFKVGKNTYIGEYNNIRAADSRIEIGDNCMISQFVSLISINHKSTKNGLLLLNGLDYEKRNIYIDNDVWV